MPRARSRNHKYRNEQVEYWQSRGYDTPTKIAHTLGYAPSTVYRWYTSGDVVGIEEGNGIYIKLDSVRAHVGVKFARDKRL